MALTVKDSLGLGINKVINKEKIYTDEENANFTRQLLSEVENEHVKNNLLSIEEVREIIIENCNKETYDNIDYELLIAIDSQINYNIYLISDNIYDYKGLCMAYPFHEFNILPESIFNRQIIVYFENSKIEVMNEGDPIVSTHDLIKLSNKKISNVEEMSKVSKLIRSKIFVGGEKWKDFLQLHGFFRGMVQISTLQIDNGQTPEYLKPFTAAICNQLTLTNGAGTSIDIGSTPIDNNVAPIDTGGAAIDSEKADLNSILKNILSKIETLEKKVAHIEKTFIVEEK
jgi:hypothetical protein